MCFPELLSFGGFREEPLESGGEPWASFHFPETHEAEQRLEREERMGPQRRESRFSSPFSPGKLRQDMVGSGRVWLLQKASSRVLGSQCGSAGRFPGELSASSTLVLGLRQE